MQMILVIILHVVDAVAKEPEDSGDVKGKGEVFSMLHLTPLGKDFDQMKTEWKYESKNQADKLLKWAAEVPMDKQVKNIDISPFLPKSQDTSMDKQEINGKNRDMKGKNLKQLTKLSKKRVVGAEMLRGILALARIKEIDAKEFAARGGTPDFIVKTAPGGEEREVIFQWQRVFQAAVPAWRKASGLIKVALTEGGWTSAAASAVAEAARATAQVGKIKDLEELAAAWQSAAKAWDTAGAKVKKKPPRKMKVTGDTESETDLEEFFEFHSNEKRKGKAKKKVSAPTCLSGTSYESIYNDSGKDVVLWWLRPGERFPDDNSDLSYQWLDHGATLQRDWSLNYSHHLCIAYTVDSHTQVRKNQCKQIWSPPVDGKFWNMTVSDIISDQITNWTSPSIIGDKSSLLDIIKSWNPPFISDMNRPDLFEFGSDDRMSHITLSCLPMAFFMPVLISHQKVQSWQKTIHKFQQPLMHV
eukprot:gnl/MRDRNA2_/MRDRNA2_122887_c0_seq1.p1 gnl/MRDRNA2_/MRDRNA2_122887_c0~~gnl/MRDRNA2_/MRDRNA2_122887_c0_seq1.p1  ORF type:complete len:471 (-),score=109.54 gnl/MRDRNA2_/MRDRNA2_122887_c0_seq1:37-1449(-)